MKVLIIEDELPAAESLQKLIREVDPGAEVIGILQSIDESVEWFETHPAPDLVLMDIHLADGSSFSIFERAEIECPIIFTTAYDQYALKAFEVNSIDYLLKPVDREHLERAIAKLRNLSANDRAEDNSAIIEKLIETMRRGPSTYRSSLLVANKDKLIPLAVNSVAFFYTENKIVRAVTFMGESMSLDVSMEELYGQLDPYLFFRANRQYILSRTSIKDISLWFNGRLAVNLSVKTPEKIFVSRANAREFKSWLTQ